MNSEEFKKRGHELVEWMGDYLDHIESYPVRSLVNPGDILRDLPVSPPKMGESFEKIFEDFNQKIMPGITHWQNPNFFAFFPANSSRISVLAEMLTATLGTQCMIWETSPAAAELEERCMEWLIQMLGLPQSFTGVIQDTASTSTLCSILTARERASDFEINERGFTPDPRFVVYCSDQTHSSIDKAVKIAGIGKENLRKIPVDPEFALIPKELNQAIEDDLAKGLKPLCVIATLGTTSSAAFDPLDAMGDICKKHDLWLHVDAAYAGTGLVLPENRWMIQGIEKADTFVFNPHKWMFTNFDCSAYFVKDEGLLIRTFEILPEYLKTGVDSQVKNYRDWGVPLGRRFRALKLWFVIRHYGVEGIRQKVKSHMVLAKCLEDWIEKSPDFEVMAPVKLGLVCFRFKPEGLLDPQALDRINRELLERLNHSGKIYLTHTALNNQYAIRLQIGQTEVQPKHVERAWGLIQNVARTITFRI